MVSSRLPYQLTKPEDVIKHLRKSEVPRIKLAVTDINGILRGKIVSLEKFLAIAELGFGFSSIVFGRDCADQPYQAAVTQYALSGYPDVRANLDLSTFREIPWEDHTPIFLGDFIDEHDRPLVLCPRQLLKQIIAQAEVAGLFPNIGVEYSWTSFRGRSSGRLRDPARPLEPLLFGVSGHSLPRSTEEGNYTNTILEQMREFDVPVESLLTNVGPGMCEAAIAQADALEAADHATLFKAGVKDIAARFGFTASFMARWHEDVPGAHGHIHVSLRNADGVNLFHDASDPQRMSPLFKNFVAGLMHCLADCLPLYAPTVNSYKRFGSGAFTPSRINWGMDNRTAAVRIVASAERETRLELRLGGADANPYLVIAATLAAGLYGIDNALPLTQSLEAGEGKPETLPSLLSQDLGAATARFRGSPLVSELFGERFVDYFVRTRRWEWESAQKPVTDWELRRYIDVI